MKPPKHMPKPYMIGHAETRQTVPGQSILYEDVARMFFKSAMIMSGK